MSGDSVQGRAPRGELGRPPRVQVVGLGPRGWQVGTWDSHGRRVRADFADHGSVGPALSAWIDRHAPGEAVTFRGEGGDGGALMRWLADDGFTVVLADPPRSTAKVAALPEGLHGHVYIAGVSQWMTTTMDTAGAQELDDWLHAFPYAFTVEVYDVSAVAPWLATELTAAGWPVVQKTANRGWYVSVECRAGVLEVRMTLSDAGVYLETEVANDDFGAAALAARILDLAPDEPVHVQGPTVYTAALAEALAVTGVATNEGPSSRGDLQAAAGAEYGGIQVQLGLQGLGWWRVRLRVASDDVDVVLAVSWSTSAWADTLAGIAGVVRERRQAVVVWSEEPGCYQLVMTPTAGGAMTAALYFLNDNLEGDPGNPHAGERTHQWTVSAREFALAWSSASHQLIGLAPEEDLTAHWPYGSRRPSWQLSTRH